MIVSELVKGSLKSLLFIGEVLISEKRRDMAMAKRKASHDLRTVETALRQLQNLIEQKDSRIKELEEKIKTLEKGETDEKKPYDCSRCSFPDTY